MKKTKQLLLAKYKCAIIGAGRIGAGFDNPKSRHVLTHAHAYFSNPKTELVGFFDTDRGRARRAAKLWSSQEFESIDELFKVARPNLISICVPDKYHFSVLKEVAKYRPRLIICEKPVTIDIKNTEAIVKLYQQINIPVLVNYSRRFDLTVQNLRQEIIKNKYGKVLCASVIYNKGILHNGSHAIDLARYFFGEVESARFLHKLNDFILSDATVSAFIKLKKCSQFYLLASDARCYSIFEFDIICEKARFRFVDSGFNMTKQSVIDSTLYKGYKILSKPSLKKTGLNNSLMEMVNNAIGHLEFGTSLLCNIEDALKTQIVCSGLSKK